jgi:hypothetical protein
MIEIFSHDVSFDQDEETEDIFIISGKGWENEPFKLYLKRDSAADLIWQMTYYINNPEFE